MVKYVQMLRVHVQSAFDSNYQSMMICSSDIHVTCNVTASTLYNEVPLCLQAMENLKSDNQRLKEENGALIRVISKLSK